MFSLLLFICQIRRGKKRRKDGMYERKSAQGKGERDGRQGERKGRNTERQSSRILTSSFLSSSHPPSRHTLFVSISLSSLSFGGGAFFWYFPSSLTTLLGMANYWRYFPTSLNETHKDYKNVRKRHIRFPPSKKRQIGKRAEKSRGKWIERERWGADRREY